MKVNSALIIGGGICGLATGLALRKIGVDAQVFEKCGELREVGAGLTLWCNGMYALKKLGACEATAAEGARVTDFRLLSASGKTLGRFDLRKYEIDLGVPNISIDRRSLMEALVSAGAGQGVQFNKDFESYRQDGSSVTAVFADGSTASGDILLACDGFNSKTRRQMLGEERPNYAGYTCWRGLTPVDADLLPQGAVWHMNGRGGVVGLLDVGHGRAAWYATATVPPGKKESPHERKEEATGRFRDWNSTVRKILEATEPGAFLKNDIFDRSPIKQWTDGRVLLMGDAAHPTTPNLGQGACQALEDAVALSVCLNEAKDHSPAFQQFQRVRTNRTAFIVNASRKAGEICHIENALACFLRDQVSRLMLSGGTTADFERTMSYKCDVV